MNSFEECKDGTQDMDRYRKYLTTEKWKEKGRKRFLIDKGTCQMCGCRGTRNNPLTMHHINYDNLYHEDPEKDMVTLCQSCHFGVHRMMNRITDSKTGERGWMDSMSVSSHVFTVNGIIRDYYIDGRF